MSPNGPLYRKVIKSFCGQVVEDALSLRKCRLDPLLAFETGVLAPLASLPPPSHPCVIFVDGIDEAYRAARSFDPNSSSHITIPELLQHISRRLPKWLSFVVTSRLGSREMNWSPKECEDLNLVGEIANADVKEYAFSRLMSVFEESKVEKCVNRVTSLAGGNFLIARLYCEVLATIPSPNREIHNLPNLYESLFDREFSEIAPLEWPRTRSLLEAMLAHTYRPYIQLGRFARYAFVRREMRLIEGEVRRFHLFGLDIFFEKGCDSSSDTERISDLLDSGQKNWLNDSGSLPSRESMVFHQSFFDWLLDSSSNPVYCCKVDRGHAFLAALSLRMLWHRFQVGVSSSHIELFFFFVTHFFFSL